MSTTEKSQKLKILQMVITQTQHWETFSQICELGSNVLAYSSDSGHRLIFSSMVYMKKLCNWGEVCGVATRWTIWILWDLPHTHPPLAAELCGFVLEQLRSEADHREREQELPSNFENTRFLCHQGRARLNHYKSMFSSCDNVVKQ